MKLIEMNRRGEAARNAAAFLYRTVTNLALNRLRDTRRRADLLASEQHGEGTTQSIDDQLTLRKILSQVGEEEARIAAYYYVDGLEQDEIAELLALNRRTVGRRLERFCKQAQALLHEVPEARHD